MKSRFLLAAFCVLAFGFTGIADAAWPALGHMALAQHRNPYMGVVHVHHADSSHTTFGLR